MKEGLSEGQHVTDEPLYVTSSVCKDCPYGHGGTRKIVTRKVRDRMHKKLLKHQCFLECTSVTVARLRGMRYPDLVCCAGFYEQYWDQTPSLAYAKGRNTIRSIYVDHLPTLTESGMLLLDPKDPVVRESECSIRLPSCSAKEWESRK